MPKTPDSRPMMYPTRGGQLQPGRQVRLPLAQTIIDKLHQHGGSVRDDDGRVTYQLCVLLDAVNHDTTMSAISGALRELEQAERVRRDVNGRRTYGVKLINTSPVSEWCVGRTIIERVPQNEVEVEDQVVPEYQPKTGEVNWNEDEPDYDTRPGNPLHEDTELDYDELAYALLRKAIESSQRRDEVEEQHKQEHDDLIRRMSQMAEEIRQTKAEANRLREKLRQAHKDEQSLQAERDQLREELRAAQAKTRNGHTVAERIDDQTRAGLEKLLREPRS